MVASLRLELKTFVNLFSFLFLFLSFFSFFLEFRRPLLNHHFLFRAIQLETIAKTRRAIAPLLGNGLRNRCRPRYTPAYDDYNGDYSVTGFSSQPRQRKSAMRIRFVRFGSHEFDDPRTRVSLQASTTICNR